MKDLIKGLVETATPETLEMSKMNCHVKGLHSIVLRSYGGRLLRCFFTTPDHEMYHNVDPEFCLALGVHNHLYSLTLSAVYGSAYNMSFEKCPQLQNVDMSRFHSKLNGGGGAERLYRSGLIGTGAERITKLELTSDELHTVYVPRETRACWLVQEGNRDKDFTTLYQNGDTSSGFDTVSANAARLFVLQELEK